MILNFGEVKLTDTGTKARLKIIYSGWNRTIGAQRCENQTNKAKGAKLRTEAADPRVDGR